MDKYKGGEQSYNIFFLVLKIKEDKELKIKLKFLSLGPKVCLRVHLEKLSVACVINESYRFTNYHLDNC